MNATQTIDRLAADLVNLGIKSGGVLLVHSSFKSLGPVPGGPETVIRALLRALGPSGTLMMPALSYEQVNDRHPVFDLQYTPSCVGAIPEHFRLRPGTIRSAHPTHSVCALGPQAHSILREHHFDSTPCGRHSPFHRLPDYQGQVLMLGCGLRPNTSMHAIEEMIQPPYLFGYSLEYVLHWPDGSVIRSIHMRHGFITHGYIQRYDRLEKVLHAPALRRGQVLAAHAWLIDAHAMWNAALVALRQDPLFFVDRKADEYPALTSSKRDPR